MRIITNINEDWKFSLNVDRPTSYPDNWEDVEIPHTWNNLDGQDGGGDYHRGIGYYAKELDITLLDNESIYLEFEGISNVAKVYINDTEVALNEAGFSTFRVDITKHVVDGINLLVVSADNSHYDHVYPQMADFTFYGGIYRDVNCIIVTETHFDLDNFGAPGLRLTSKVDGDNAFVTVETNVLNPSDVDHLAITILDENLEVVSELYSIPTIGVHTILIEDVNLWQGVEDPYLYTAIARVYRNNDVIDEVSDRFGVREFYVNPAKGFFLNGKLTPLRGVSRHQDRKDVGNALSFENQLEDALIIKELGANTIRLAHYQHSQAFYDLCDELGFVVWAEIPFISNMNKEPMAHDNATYQMEALIRQNYNHPSICMWGIANEITIGGDSPKLVENLKDLNRLTKELDPTRLTTLAQVTMVPLTSEHNHITDIVSYNHYFGWYFGEMSMNEQFFDGFHMIHPNRAIGISEYGCEGNIRIHSDTPEKGDYSEEYQALYHEHMAKIIDERPWLWATHNWNMFDFAADNRNEGGVKGRNNKGLVTYDRNTYKDSFYVYKAYWSDEPFVHITGRRYGLRPYEVMDIKVYSNLSSVTLSVNGKVLESQDGDKIFIFKDVELTESTTITATSGAYRDSVTFTVVESPLESYALPKKVKDPNVENWFAQMKDTPVLETIDPTSFSVKDTIGDLIENEHASAALMGAMGSFSDMTIDVNMLKMVGGMVLEDILGMMGDQAPPEVLNFLNTMLQKIEK